MQQQWLTDLLESPDYLGEITFMGFSCYLCKTAYQNNQRTALALLDKEDGAVVTIATVNLPDDPIGDDEVFIKNYSENAGMLDALLEAGYVQDTGRFVRTGHVTIPVCKLLPKTENG